MLELPQKKSSKAEQVSVSFSNKSQLTELFSEKYLKKLIGKNDIEDALKRLDRLTQEEARMAAAQLLKVTNTIDNRVEGIADDVLVVNNRVACIDDRVIGVDERVAGVDERVAGVDERMAGVNDRVKDVDDNVRAVDDKLVVVIDGAQYIFTLFSKVAQLLTHLDGKETRGAIQQAADGVDRMERSWFTNPFMLDMQAHSSQGINYDRIFVDGSRHQIHLQITISHATPITRERRPGFSKEGCIRNGSHQVPSRYSGSMENVCTCPILLPDAT